MKTVWLVFKCCALLYVAEHVTRQMELLSVDSSSTVSTLCNDDLSAESRSGLGHWHGPCRAVALVPVVVSTVRSVLQGARLLCGRVLQGIYVDTVRHLISYLYLKGPGMGGYLFWGRIERAQHLCAAGAHGRGALLAPEPARVHRARRAQGRQFCRHARLRAGRLLPVLRRVGSGLCVGHSRPHQRSATTAAATPSNSRKHNHSNHSSRFPRRRDSLQGLELEFELRPASRLSPLGTYRHRPHGQRQQPQDGR